MGISRALNSATTGLKTNQLRLDVLGHNVSNLNTTGFKGERISFQTNFSATLNAGTAPGDTVGGTNPLQIGFGASTSSIQTDFTQGSFDPTGRNADLAIDGAGFFILKDESGGELYTRDGTFDISALDTNGVSYLVNQKGFRLQGFDADGVMGDIPVTMGESSSAITTSAGFIGNLNASGDLYVPAGFDNFDLGVDGNLNLTDVLATDADLQIGGIGQFAVGDTYTISAARGNDPLSSATAFTVGAASTVDDFLNWMTTQLNLDTAAGEAAQLNAAGTGLEIETAPGTDPLANVVMVRNGGADPFNIDFSNTVTGEEAETPQTPTAPEYEFRTPKPLWAESDPEDWWSATVEACRQV
ncbi:MAG: flagellar hook-basal body complex protein, partial [Planctomycetota bacterium]